MSDNMTVDPVAEFAAALAVFQDELPHIAKESTADTGSFSYSYADLTLITERAFPLLSKHGFAFTCGPHVREDGHVVLRYTLLHKAGHSLTGDYPLPSSGTPQQLGSAITYGRRYCLCAVTGIAPGGEDDDGANAAETTISRQPQRTSDEAWLYQFDALVTSATTPAELDGIEAEAKAKYDAHQLTADDARGCRKAIEARRKELTA